MARQHLAEEHGCSFNDHQAEEHHCDMKLCIRFLHASDTRHRTWELTTSQEVHMYMVRFVLRRANLHKGAFCIADPMSVVAYTLHGRGCLA